MSFPSFFEQVAVRLNTWPEPPMRVEDEEKTADELPPEDDPRPRWVDPSDGRRAASWAFDSRREDEPITSFAPGDVVGDSAANDLIEREIDDLWVDFMDRRARRKPDPEIVAQYKPWHVHGSRWGIYFHDSWVLALVVAVARGLGEPPARVGPLVLRQVLAHEYIHFAFEVAGTQLEDVLGKPRYVTYLHERYDHATRFGDGPLEEAVAAYAEIEFARSAAVRRTGISSADYALVVARHLSASGPGYRDHVLMTLPPRARQVVAEVAALIADRTMSSSRWDQVSSAEKRQVPMYWVGDPATLSVVGALPKSVAAPTIRQTEKWLRGIGATIETGAAKGSHAKARLANGRTVSYARGAGVLLRPEARKLAHAVEMRNERELFLAIADMPRPQTRPARATRDRITS